LFQEVAMTPILQGRTLSPEAWGGFAAGASRTALLERRYRTIPALGIDPGPGLGTGSGPDFGASREGMRAMSCESPGEPHAAPTDATRCDAAAIDPARAAHRVGPAAQLPHRLAPLALDGQPFGQRFRYWYGRSGRRYLFSEMTGDAATDLTDAVYLVAGPSGTEERPLFVGAALPSPAACSGRIFVHLLADDADARADVVADLTPAPL
jgi:hypothetical protein